MGLVDREKNEKIKIHFKPTKKIHKELSLGLFLFKLCSSAHLGLHILTKEKGVSINSKPIARQQRNKMAMDSHYFFCGHSPGLRKKGKKEALLSAWQSLFSVVCFALQELENQWCTHTLTWLARAIAHKQIPGSSTIFVFVWLLGVVCREYIHESTS